MSGFIAKAGFAQTIFCPHEVLADGHHWHWPSHGSFEGARMPSNAMHTRAFGSPEIMAGKISLALENYRLTPATFDAKFDRVPRGEKKFTAAEQRGFELFSTEHDPRRGQFGAGFTFEFRRVSRFTSAECDHLNQSIYCCSPRCFF